MFFCNKLSKDWLFDWVNKWELVLCSQCPKGWICLKTSKKSKSEGIFYSCDSRRNHCGLLGDRDKVAAVSVGRWLPWLHQTDTSLQDLSQTFLCFLTQRSWKFPCQDSITKLPNKNSSIFNIFLINRCYTWKRHWNTQANFLGW